MRGIGVARRAIRTQTRVMPLRPRNLGAASNMGFARALHLAVLGGALLVSVAATTGWVLGFYITADLYHGTWEIAQLGRSRLRYVVPWWYVLIPGGVVALFAARGFVALGSRRRVGFPVLPLKDTKG